MQKRSKSVLVSQMIDARGRIIIRVSPLFHSTLARLGTVEYHTSTLSYRVPRAHVHSLKY